MNILEIKSLKLISSLDDFPEPIDKTIYLQDGHNYCILGVVDVGDNKIVCPHDVTIFGISQSSSKLMSSSLPITTPLIFSNNTVIIKDITVSSNWVFDLNGLDALTGETLSWENVDVVNSSKIGVIKNYQNATFNSFKALNSSGLEFDGDFFSLGFMKSLFTSVSLQAIIKIKSTCNILRALVFELCTFAPMNEDSIGLVCEAGFQVPNESFLMSNVSFEGLGTYLSGVAHNSLPSNFTNLLGVESTFINGYLYMKDNSITTTISSRNVFVKVGGNTVLDASSDRFSMPSNNRIRCDASIARKYLVVANIGFFTSSANDVVEFAFFNSRTNDIIHRSRMKATSFSSSKSSNCTITDSFYLVDGDYIELHVTSSTPTSVTVSDLTMIVTQIK